MLRKVFSRFELERDRAGMLGERQLLACRVPGNAGKDGKLVATLADLEAWKDKYEFISTGVPSEDMPKERTLFNFMFDELEKHPLMEAKIERCRGSAHGSAKRTTRWLWGKMENIHHLQRAQKAE